jgi:putative FmdB family regulatory protein
MPLYEYYCQSCERRFELLRPVSRMDNPAVCPEGHGGANRVLSTFAAFTQGDSGASEALAGTNPCSGCAADTCSTCNLN